MPRTRKSTVVSLLRGLLAAVALTLIGMLLMTAAITWLHMSDGCVHALNQLLKIVAIAVGVCEAVRRGGEMGFATGTLLALAYMVLGYGAYLGLGGGCFNASSMLGEMLVCSVAGAVTGTIRANMRAKARRGASDTKI